MWEMPSLFCPSDSRHRILQQEQSEGPLARTACWGPQALEVLSPGLWCQGWLLPPAPSGHPLHAGVLWGGGGDTRGDRASTELPQ